MAFRDSWHRALVYFGLAEEYHDDYEEEAPPEAELEDRYRERPNVRRLRRRRDEYDEIFAEDDRADAAGGHGRATTVLRPVGGRGSGNGGVKVHLVVPKSFNDAQQVADKFKDSIPVILNLQGTETDLAKRLIDFASGLTYALEGGMQRIADKVFMLTPRNVEISAEERARLIEKGFFNQS
jgi:cell division inhibitor SepF